MLVQMIMSGYDFLNSHVTTSNVQCLQKSVEETVRRGNCPGENTSRGNISGYRLTTWRRCYQLAVSCCRRLQRQRRRVQCTADFVSGANA